jgi:uncharacterized membrane protein
MPIRPGAVGGRRERPSTEDIDPMSELVVVIFASEASGPAALAHVRDLSQSGRIEVEDSAVITKDPDGRTHVTNQVSSGTKAGAVVGGMIGLLLATFFLPVFGLLAGAAAGGLFGRSMTSHVDKDFVADVTAELQPGTSALFVVVKGDPGALTLALGPFKGKVFQTTLDPDLEAALNESLKTGS